MNVKELSQKGYDLFNAGDMESFFNDLVDDNIIWTFPGDKHPLSGTHKGKQAMMTEMSKIPGLWDNFKVEPKLMIAEGEYVFVLAHGTATGMDADFGHLFKVQNEKISEFHILDDSQKWAATMKAM